MTQYETYIFDLDGTLLDTLGDLAASTNHALRTNGMAERTVDEVRRFVGNGVKRLMERAVPGGEGNPKFAATLDEFRRHYLVHSLDTTQPYPGITDMLAQLKARNKGVAVVSNKFNAAAEELCQHFFGSLVDVAIGESPTLRRKPAPDMVVEALQRLGANKASAVYIGDSDVDISTARAAGLPCISVLWGFRDADFLKAHGAQTLISAPSEITD